MDSGPHQKLTTEDHHKMEILDRINIKTTNVLPLIALLFAIFFPIIGLILGIIALSQINKDPSLRGRNMAIAAIIIGFFFTILPIVYIIGIVKNHRSIDQWHDAKASSQLDGPVVLEHAQKYTTIHNWIADFVHWSNIPLVYFRHINFLGRF